MLWLMSFFYLVHSQDVGHVQILSGKDYKFYLREEQWNTPGCILFHNESHSLKQFSELSLNVSMKFMSIYSSLVDHEVQTPVIQCFVGQFKPETFRWKKRKKFTKWLKSQPKKVPYTHLTKPDIELLSLKDNVYIVIMLPGNHYFQSMLTLAQKFFNEGEELKIDTYIVPPKTKCERILFKKQIVSAFPSIVIYHRKSAYKAAKVVKHFDSPYEVEEVFVKLFFLVETMKSFIVTAELLQLYTNFNHYVKTPVLLCIYSSKSEASFKTLHAFHRTLTEFTNRYKSAVQFGIFDISEHVNSNALERYLTVRNISSIPFTLCIYQLKTDQGTMKVDQKAITAIPTIHTVELFFQSLKLMPPSMSGRKFYLNTCPANVTDFCVVSDNFVIEKTPVDAQTVSKVKGNRMRKRKKGKLHMMTERIWNGIFTSDKPFDHNILSASSRSKLLLVIFIQAGCSFCQLSFPEFEKVAKGAAYLPNVFVYLMNCTVNMVRCKKLHVSGYPTLLLFRVVSTYKYDQCLPNQYFLEPVITDYHGNVQAEEILEWLSGFTLPVIKFPGAEQHLPSYWQDKDVRLIVRLYTKRYASRYLPRSLNNRMLPLHCLYVICDLLYARADCFGIPEDNTFISAHDKDLVVSSVEFERADGARSVLFKTGVPMQRSLNEEAGVGASFFHHSHRYNISSTFRCEDDHRKCDDVMIEFINDHAHMPITHINTAMFHSHQKSKSDLGRKPILMALVHAQNVTRESKFYKQLYAVAVKLYKDVNVAVLDVDKHPHWANLFVPRGYYSQSNHSNEDFTLHRYPRICLINLDDHQHAAFYPIVVKDVGGGVNIAHAHITNSIDIEELSIFVKAYLTNRMAVVVETEHF